MVNESHGQLLSRKKQLQLLSLFLIKQPLTIQQLLPIWRFFTGYRDVIAHLKLTNGLMVAVWKPGISMKLVWKSWSLPTPLQYGKVNFCVKNWDSRMPCFQNVVSIVKIQYAQNQATDVPSIAPETRTKNVVLTMLLMLIWLQVIFHATSEQ